MYAFNCDIKIAFPKSGHMIMYLHNFYSLAVV